MQILNKGAQFLFVRWTHLKKTKHQPCSAKPSLDRPGGSKAKRSKVKKSIKFNTWFSFQLKIFRRIFANIKNWFVGKCYSTIWRNPRNLNVKHWKGNGCGKNLATTAILAGPWPEIWVSLQVLEIVFVEWFQRVSPNGAPNVDKCNHTYSRFYRIL